MEFEFPIASWVWVGKSTLKSRLGRAVHIWGFFCWSRRVLSLSSSSHTVSADCFFKSVSLVKMFLQGSGRNSHEWRWASQGPDKRRTRKRSLLSHLVSTLHTFLGSFAPFYKPSLSTAGTLSSQIISQSWTRSPEQEAYSQAKLQLVHIYLSAL